jgi:chromosome segregation ATPase
MNGEGGLTVALDSDFVLLLESSYKQEKAAYSKLLKECEALRSERDALAADPAQSTRDVESGIMALQRANARYADVVAQLAERTRERDEAWEHQNNLADCSDEVQKLQGWLQNTEKERDALAVYLDYIERRLIAADKTFCVLKDPRPILAAHDRETRRKALLEAADRARDVGNAGVGRWPSLTESELRRMAEEGA